MTWYCCVNLGLGILSFKLFSRLFLSYDMLFLEESSETTEPTVYLDYLFYVSDLAFTYYFG